MADLTNDVWHQSGNDSRRNNESARRLSNNADDSDSVMILKSIDKHLVENQHLLKGINHQLVNVVCSQAIGDDIAIAPRFFRYMSERDLDFDLQYLQALRNSYTQNNG